MNNIYILLFFVIFILLILLKNQMNCKENLKNTKKSTNKNVYSDKFSKVDIVYKNSKLIEKINSKYQEIKMYYDTFFGYMLVIDDDVQITESDQYIYHEMIVNFPLNYNHNGKKVLVIGGGDGGTVTEICKFKNIDEIIWIEIDQEVINICEKYFPNLSSGRYDKRTKLVIDDGAKWVKDNLKTYKRKW